MKVAMKLTDEARKSAEAFLLRYDKHAHGPQYDMGMAIDLVERKALESPNCDYELRTFDTTTGVPESISFSDDELIFKEVEE